MGNTSLVHHLYFESSAIIIYFVKLGRYIDKISKNKTKEAIQKYGSLKGTSMAMKRILRCNPFSKGGYDPVP